MPLLFHVPFVLSGGNVADFLNGTVTRTTKVTATWQIVLYSNSEGQSIVFFISPIIIV